MRFEIKDYPALRSAMDEFCAFLLAEKVCEERVFDTKVAVYELIGNALKYSGGGAVLCGEAEGEHITLTIKADKPFCPPNETVCADVFAEHGRGLFLVDKLCEKRTVAPDGTLIILIKTK